MNNDSIIPVFIIIYHLPDIFHSPVTPSLIALSPTALSPTTPSPTAPSPTTPSPTTLSPTTPSPTTPSSTTGLPASSSDYENSKGIYNEDNTDSIASTTGACQFLFQDRLL